MLMKGDTRLCNGTQQSTEINIFNLLQARGTTKQARRAYACCITIRQHHEPCRGESAGPGIPIDTLVADREGERKGKYLPITTDSIRRLLGGVLRFFGLDRIHCGINFALDVVRDGLARRLCSFEE